MHLPLIFWGFYVSLSTLINLFLALSLSCLYTHTYLPYLGRGLQVNIIFSKCIYSNCFSLLPQTPSHSKSFIIHSQCMGILLQFLMLLCFVAFFLLKKYLLTEEDGKGDVQVHPASHNPHEKKIPKHFIEKKKEKTPPKNHTNNNKI